MDARRVQATAQRCLGDDAAMPDGIQEIISAHDPVTGGDEEPEDVEDLRLECNEGAALAQLAPGGIEGEIAQTDRSREARTVVLPGVMAFGAVIDENYVEAPDMG